MTSATRWLAVVALALVIVSVPVVLRHLPAEESTISAVALAKKSRGTADLGWSGEVRSQGALEVPLSGSTFGGVARLLGEQSDLRVWWRDAEHWRVDRTRTSGESDQTRDGASMLRWTYESNRATFTPYSPVRLPTDTDVVPVALASRLLAGARPSELSRLDSRRVAGRSAAGLRLVPSDDRSTIARVDVWADQSSSLPLRVDVYAEGAPERPVLSTELVTLDLDAPTGATLETDLARGVDVRRSAALDEAAGANAFAPFVPPASIADLPRRGQPESFGAVGVYGRGPTAVLAVPLRESVARGLQKQLSGSPQANIAGNSTSLEIGPLSVLLTRRQQGNFLLTGTVSPETLGQAAIDLASGVRRTR